MIKGGDLGWKIGVGCSIFEMNKDPLDFVYRICVRPVDTIFVKILGVATTIVMIIYQIFTTNYLLNNDAFFFNYMMYLAAYFYILSISAFLFLIGLLTRTAKFIRSDLTSAGYVYADREKIASRTAPYKRMMVLHCSIYAIITVCACIFLIPWSEFMKKYTYMERFTREHPLMYSFYLTYVAVAYLMYLNCYILPYFMLHTVFQCEIMLEIIGTLMVKKTDFGLLENRPYQQAVRGKLRECCIVNAHIKRMVHGCIEYTYEIGAVFVTILCFLIACFLVYMEQATSDSDLTALMIFATLIIAIDYFLFLYLKSGQLIEDKTSLIFDQLCQCPWYTWNEENTQVYLILLTHTYRPSNVYTVKGLLLNWTTLVKIARIVTNLYLFLKTIKAI